MLCFFSAKGGAGCSVVAASTALLLADLGPTLLVDLAGDQPDVLGVSAGPVDAGSPWGLARWVATSDPEPDALRWLERPVVDRLVLLASGGGALRAGPERLHLLAGLLAGDPRHVVVDLGDHEHFDPVLAHATRSVLVTRPCYVALSRARSRPSPDEVVLVDEPHRALTANDVSAVLDAPVTAVIPYEPRVFRTVDAGLLVSRIPRSLRRLEVFR